MEKYDFSLLYRPTAEEKLLGIQQDNQHWLDARRGRITASDRAHKILYARNSTLNTMMDQMAYELTKPAEDGYSGRHTEHGHAFEEQAIDEYSMMRLSFDPVIKTPGMFVHPTFDIASATPDFFEGEDVTGQVKCPAILSNHNELLHFGVRAVNKKYYTQVQFESFVTGRPRIMFVSYHPDATATNQIHIEEVERNEAMHEQFRRKLADIHHMLVNDQRFDVKKTSLTLDDIPSLF